MRFDPRINVRGRLTLAFLAVIFLSWALSYLTFRFFLERDIQRINREMHERDTRGRIEVVGPMGRLNMRPPDGSFRGPDRGGRGPRGFRRGLPPPVRQSLPFLVLIGTALSLGAGWWLSRRFSGPLAALAEGAHAFHERRFDHRIPTHGGDEFADVAQTMNEMAEQVGRQISELEADARRRRQVLVDVAHELRSPVTTLEAMALALKEGKADDPARRAEAIDFLIDSSGRMRRLVNDLLEIARLDLHELPLVCAPVDLRELAEDVVYTHRTAAREAGVAFREPEAGEPVEVEADRLRIAQVLDNLVENAIAYAGPGSEISVRVTADPPGMVVEDTGAGIPAEHMPFIFDPFYRASAARTPGENHSGLGLRIARGLMEAHGGALTLESEEGKGTRALIAFSEAPSGASMKSGQGTAVSRRSGTS